MLLQLLLTFMSNVNPRGNLKNIFERYKAIYLCIKVTFNNFSLIVILSSSLTLLFFKKCAHMAIHVTFSMINSLVHSFCECLCALWEILKQRKAQTKKYHDNIYI